MVLETPAFDLRAGKHLFLTVYQQFVRQIARGLGLAFLAGRPRSSPGRLIPLCAPCCWIQSYRTPGSCPRIYASRSIHFRENNPSPRSQVRAALSDKTDRSGRTG